MKSKVKCPKWRALFESNIVKQDNRYTWKFDANAVWSNLKNDSPNSLTGWNPTVGIYPGRVCFAFPDNSRHVYLNTNTMPMLKVCIQSKGFLEDIFSVQGDEGVQNHWVYEREDEINPYAWRVAQFLKHYDGVHVLLQNRDEVGRVYVPDIVHVRNPKDEVSTEHKPGHYYHNWRFNNVYGDIKKD